MNERASVATPRRFWLCRSCGKRGDVFDAFFDDALAAAIDVEAGVTGAGGAVSHPVDPGGTTRAR
jgi:hypothetical protein